MSNIPTVDELRQRHDEVYGELLRNPSLARSGPQRDAFLAERVYPLLNDLKALPASGISVADYAWLSDTAIQWQVVFSSIFNIPRTIQIAPPQQLNPPTERYTPDALDDLLKRESFYLSQARMLEGLAEYIRHYRSTPAEMDRDWYNAKTNLAYWLLEGDINFAQQLTPASYHHIEEVWLEDLRRVTGYFHWVAEGRKLWNHDADYRYACAHLREQLTNPRLKASRRDFVAVQEYLETRYLADGELDHDRPAVAELIRAKAHRLWVKTGNPNPGDNWRQAIATAAGFYEHIIPAVLEGETKDIAAVLSALRADQGPAYDAAINCFEALVAVYFLDPNVLQKRFRKQVATAL